MMAKIVTYQLEENMAIVTIDNPPMNAINDQAKDDLEAVFDELNDQIDQVKVVILTGAGDKAFVAGGDIKEFPHLNPERAKARLKRSRRLFVKMEQYERPVICAINGFCLGAGLEIAMCCDIRIATEKSKFGQPETNLALIPGSGGTQRLPRLVGTGIAKELIFTGRFVNADEAKNIGLINLVTPKGKHLDEAKEMAKTLCSKSPLALRAAKEAIDRGMNMTLDNGLDIEADLWCFLCGTQDQKEGARAFIEKREPVFKGK
jgi:enoyl-CoA hydratase